MDTLSATDQHRTGRSHIITPTNFKIYTRADKKVIERIITHRIYEGQVQFLVRFKSTNPIDDTWLDKEDPAMTTQLIQKYNQNLLEDETTS